MPPIGLVFGTLLLFGIHQSESAFNTDCSTSFFGCVFRNGIAQDSVDLACDGKKCVCRNPEHRMMDTALYNVELVGEECIAKGQAPCGTSNGITLGCESGRSCIEGRCRLVSEKLRSTPLGHSCREDIDCQEGLKCIWPGGFSVRRCQAAESRKFQLGMI